MNYNLAIFSKYGLVTLLIKCSIKSCYADNLCVCLLPDPSLECEGAGPQTSVEIGQCQFEM